MLIRKNLSVKIRILMSCCFIILCSCSKDDVKQAAPSIVVQAAGLDNVSFEPSELKIAVVANIGFDVTWPDAIDWLTLNGRQTSNDTTFILLKVGLNLSTEKREAKIAIKQQNGNLTQWITVTQSGCSNDYRPVTPDGIAGDSLLAVASGWASSFQGGSGIEKSFDGDINTFYHSNWSNGGSNYFPITLEYNFENVDRMDYLVYTPRPDGQNGRFKEVEIWYKSTEITDYKFYKKFDFKGSGLASRVDFSPSLLNSTGIRFVVKSGAGDGQGFASCAEMKFYQKRPLSAVFSDATCSALNQGVTYEQIMAMDNEFMKNIARALYLNTYPVKQRVRSYEPYRDPDAIASEYKITPYNQLDNATGIYAQAGEELAIFVGDIPTGEHVSLRVMDWANGYTGSSYVLMQGLNKVTSANKGLLYVIYNTENYRSAAPVKIHIASGAVNGWFDSRINSDKEWAGMLVSATAGYLDVQGEYSHLVFPVSSLKNYVGSPLKLLEAYDKMVWLEHDLMGLHKYNHTLKNRMFFHSVTGDVYTYATSYRTAYQEETLAEILNVSKFKTSAIWEPARQVGHMHQTRPGLRWIGLGEVTNNIFSLYVQTAFGNRSRLISEDMGNGVTRFEAAYDSIIVVGIPHGKEGDVFCKLVPFWQLLLYSQEVLNDADLYKDLNEQMRNTVYSGDNNSKNGICQLNFVKMVCDRLQLDLRSYFRAWGFLREIDERIEDYSVERLWITAAQIAEVESYIVSKSYPKAPEGLIYLNDDNWSCFKTNTSGGYAPIVKGQATREGNRVSMTGWENVVAYEVMRNGKVIEVFNSNSFVVKGSGGFSIKAVAANGKREDVIF